MALQLFAEGDQVYVACETCCHAFRGAREPIDCSADELALLEIDLYAASACELCEQAWAPDTRVRIDLGQPESMKSGWSYTW